MASGTLPFELLGKFIAHGLFALNPVRLLERGDFKPTFALFAVRRRACAQSLIKPSTSVTFAPNDLHSTKLD